MLVVIYGKLAEDMNMKKYHKQLKKLSPDQLLTKAEKKAIKKKQKAAEKAEQNGPADAKYIWRPKQTQKDPQTAESKKLVAKPTESK